MIEMNLYQQDYIFIQYKQRSSDRPRRWYCLSRFYGNEEGPFLKLGDDLFEATSLQWCKVKLKDDGERD